MFPKIRRAACLVPLVLVPLGTAGAQTRAVTQAPTSPVAERTVRTYTGGRFIIEVDGALQQSWTYDPLGGTLTPTAAPTSAVARRAPRNGISVIVVSDGSPDVTAKGPPIPSIGVVVKSNVGGAPSNRTRMQRILLASEAPADARTTAGQPMRYFPLPTDIIAGTYDIVITLPRAALAAVAPAGTRGDTELTFTVNKVPGGYDAVRPAALR
ncbi:MAG: hypothetical protein H7099_19165 [Gemmatimonadaceae bacterium]|nr:hypothetical protein [Gemmatimonadaceae bacterium]